MKKNRLITMMSVCVFWMGSLVWGQNENIISQQDISLKKVVENKLHSMVWYTARDYVNIEVSKGIVTLSGWVNGFWKTGKIEEIMKNISGVREINNEIVSSNGSDELAGRALSAIYRDAMFRKYVLAADLPVHVIVQNNMVILAGKVSVESERYRAEFLVDALTSAVAIDNRLVFVD